MAADEKKIQHTAPAASASDIRTFLLADQKASCCLGEDENIA
jgi:hypothetical protein